MNRAARRDDHWRNVFKKAHSLVHLETALHDVALFGDATVTFAPPITAICGGNGVGKSTLLRLVRRALSQGTAEELELLPTHLRVGSCAVSLEVDGASHTWHVDIADEGSPVLPEQLHIDTLHIDPFTLCREQIAFLRETQNFGEMLESVEPSAADPKDLADTAAILRRDYESLLTFEVPDAIVDDEVMPYFQVSWQGQTYDSASMGLGELAVHNILWALRRAERGTVVLLEEPESFIAPFSQGHLLDILAREVLENDFCLIFTTHSPDMIRRVPLGHIRLVTAALGGAEVSTLRRESDLREALGVAVPVKVMAWVEDEMALAFTTLITEALGFRYAREVELSVAGGSGDVLKAVNGLPTRMRRLGGIGLLDGDQTLPQKSPWPVLLLPGGGDPEELLRAAVLKNIDGFSDALGRDLQHVRPILDSCAGLDGHDWLEELGGRLALNRTQLAMAMVRTWLADPENLAAAQDFIETLESTFEDFRLD